MGSAAAEAAEGEEIGGFSCRRPSGHRLDARRRTLRRESGASRANRVRAPRRRVGRPMELRRCGGVCAIRPACPRRPARLDRESFGKPLRHGISRRRSVGQRGRSLAVFALEDSRRSGLQESGQGATLYGGSLPAERERLEGSATRSDLSSREGLRPFRGGVSRGSGEPRRTARPAFDLERAREALDQEVAVGACDRTASVDACEGSEKAEMMNF